MDAGRDSSTWRACVRPGAISRSKGISRRHEAGQGATCTGGLGELARHATACTEIPPVQTISGRDGQGGRTCAGKQSMPSFLDCRIDADAILADIEAITRIESPTSDKAGVNRVLDTIAGWFEDT